MDSFAQSSINIPRLWEKDWQKAISESEGADKELLTFEARAVNMLKEISDKQLTPFRLGWFSLWTKLFSALEGSRTSLDRSSEYVLKILSRVVFETSLHILTIIEPVHKINELEKSALKVSISKEAEKKAWYDVKERIHAYTAWCLWNDKRNYDEKLKPLNLDKAWDPNPAKEIAADQESLKSYEAVFGTLNQDTEFELKTQRRKQEKEFKKARNKLLAWLHHPQLEPWYNKLQHAFLQNKQLSSFYALFDDSETGVRNRLQDFDLNFTYSLYQEGSLFIHGSTMVQLFSLQDNLLTPIFFTTEEEAEAAAIDVGYYCNRNFILLYLLLKELWQE